MTEVIDIASSLFCRVPTYPSPIWKMLRSLAASPLSWLCLHSSQWRQPLDFTISRTGYF